MHTTVRFNNLTNDLAFKYIFSKGNLLTDLINSYFDYINLDRKVLKLIMPERIILAKRRKLKDYYGDIVVVTDKDEIISIEMYSSFNQVCFNKSLVYMARLYSNQLNKNESYKNLHKVTCLNFIIGNYKRISSNLINSYNFTNLGTLVPMIENIMEFVLIRLDLSNKSIYDDSNKRFIRWLKLINAKSLEEMHKIGKGDEIMEEAIKNLQAFLSEEAETFDREAFIKEQYTYDGEQKGLEKGLKQGKRQGLKQGLKQGILKTAKNMLSNNYEIAEISKVTGLSIKEINELKEEM